MALPPLGDVECPLQPLIHAAPKSFLQAQKFSEKVLGEFQNSDVEAI
jgi:hypothetical protein